MRNDRIQSGEGVRTVPADTQGRQRRWGIFVRKERWGLSWRGWLIVVATAILTCILLWFHIYPFLAVTHRVNANVLVVEGWIHEYAIRAAVEEFKRGSYERVFATGGPVEGTGGYTNDYNTSASVGAELLQKCGLPAKAVQMVPSHVMDRDRTYGSAIALRDWFRDRKISVRGVNVLTENVHARRTRLFFDWALGSDTSVGIIAVPNPDYDSKYWWRYSEGVKDVVGETVGYLYARLFFRAPNAKSIAHRE